nr:chromatin remodeling protein EBS-like [Ipomoea batatas]GMD47112.1 chromatin remodeling protein EBS-like [Ipomoea batatas]
MVASCGYEQRQRQVSRYCKYELPYNSDDLMVQCEECKAWYRNILNTLC